MNYMNSEEYTLDIVQASKVFIKKWWIWTIVAIFFASLLFMKDYISQKKEYNEYLNLLESSKADDEELINEKEILIDPEEAREALTEAEKETVTNALDYYHVMLDRQYYRDNSALNQLDGTNTKNFIARYILSSPSTTTDMELFKNLFLSDKVSESISEYIKEYKKEFVAEVTSVSSNNSLVIYVIMIPENVDEDKFFQLIDNEVKLFANERSKENEGFKISFVNYEVRHLVSTIVTNNILNSANNYVSSWNTLDSYLTGMTDNAKAVYYNELGKPYYVKNDNIFEEKEPIEPVNPPKKDFKLVLIGLISGVAVCYLVYLSIQIISGKIYYRALVRVLELDYGADYWSNNREIKSIDVENNKAVIENIGIICNSRRTILVEFGEFRENTKQGMEDIEQKISEHIKRKVVFNERPFVELMDSIEDKSSELLIMLDVKRNRYGKVVKFVNSLKKEGFERVACICLH